jgi:hypothetical protein
VTPQAETPLIHVDQPTTVNDDMKPIRIDIEDVGAAPLRVVGISPVVLVTIEVAPSVILQTQCLISSA